jgi:teichuronic acid biosynthesis glycosyltransferase TuaH
VRDIDRQLDRPLVLVIAGTSWDGIWQSERHIAMHLAEKVPVLWVDPQMSHLSPMRDRTAAASLRGPRLRRVAPNILRLSPVTVPGVTRPILREIAVRQARRTVRRTVAALGANVHSTIVASVNNMLDVIPSAQSLLYGTDDWVAGAELLGAEVGWLRKSTERQLARADIVVASSPTLKEKWSSYRPDISVVPNGCDAARLATADSAPDPRDVHLPRPIAGFVGHMSERIDLAMLDAVATAGVSVLLVGPRQPTFDIAKLKPLLERPNVQWVGAKDFGELPSYLKVIDVGLTPYRQSDFNRASFPLKNLEYLAAGRPVVASDLPAHRWLDSPHVSIADTPAEFAAHAVALIRAPGSPEDASARRAFAARHSWDARATDIAELLGLDGRTAGEKGYAPGAAVREEVGVIVR